MLRADKETIHSRDLPSGKRRALIEEVFVNFEDTAKN